VINIIKGRKNQGKTQKILTLFQEYQKCSQPDGVASLKIFKNEIHIGYELLHLSSQRKFPLAFKKDHIPLNWKEYKIIGDYTFSDEGFFYSESIFSKEQIGAQNPLFLDEIGPLELEGFGFYTILQDLKDLERDIFITSRPECVDPIIHKFNLKRYKIFEISKRVRNYFY